MSAPVRGPWRVSYTSPFIIVEDFGMIGDGGGRLIGSAASYPGSGLMPDDDEAIENARLFAASPDLLAACEAALLRDDVADDELGAMIRQAVEKATMPATARRRF